MIPKSNLKYAEKMFLEVSFLLLSLSLPDFPSGLEGKASACNEGDRGSIPGSGRSPGEGNGNPVQYYCLENPMDRGVWQATVYGVAKSQTRLSDFTQHFSKCLVTICFHKEFQILQAIQISVYQRFTQVLKDLEFFSAQLFELLSMSIRFSSIPSRIQRWMTFCDLFFQPSVCCNTIIKIPLEL